MYCTMQRSTVRTVYIYYSQRDQGNSESTVRTIAVLAVYYVPRSELLPLYVL